jgi:hypothetical protein
MTALPGSTAACDELPAQSIRNRANVASQIGDDWQHAPLQHQPVRT